MNNSDWPTFAEVESLAQKAHFDGFYLDLCEIETGWEWVWLHSASGMTFEGSCDCHVLCVAFVCALQALPIVIFNVDPNDVGHAG